MSTEGTGTCMACKRSGLSPNLLYKDPLGGGTICLRCKASSEVPAYGPPIGRAQSTSFLKPCGIIMVIAGLICGGWALVNGSVAVVLALGGADYGIDRISTVLMLSPVLLVAGVVFWFIGS